VAAPPSGLLAHPFPPPTLRRSPHFVRMGTGALVDRAAADALICEANTGRRTDAPVKATACPAAVASSVDCEFRGTPNRLP